MGLRDKYAKEIEEQGFRPLELSEENVQTIFNRCLAKPDSKETTSSDLFSIATGYSVKDGRIIKFDKINLERNKQNIEYLYGQLGAVHANLVAPKFPIADLISLYTGNFWAKDTNSLFKLLYLGVVPELNLINPVLAKDRTTVIRKTIKPTLSPKDPAFPAWWEAHKAEWEQ